MYTHTIFGIISVDWCKNHLEIPILSILNMRFIYAQNYKHPFRIMKKSAAENEIHKINNFPIL